MTGQTKNILSQLLLYIRTIHRTFVATKLAVFVFVCLVLAPVLATVYTYTRGGEHAYAATSSTLNFQARLANINGSSVPDGLYNIRFKLYDGGTQGGPSGTGQANSGTGGTYLWTEQYIQSNRVRVVNGYFSVNLGSITSFPNTINWSQELWLTMDIGGTTNTPTPTYDGEMTNANARTKLTAVPYAFRAGQADTLTTTGGTITGDDVFTKVPTTIQTVNGAVAGLRFNQVGSGGLLQLQSSGTDVFTVDNSGNVAFKGALAVSGASASIGTTSVAGSLVLSDGSSNTGTLLTAALGADRTYTFPDVSGTVCLVSTCVSNGFLNGGNSFGGLATLGTNDTFGLEFETDGTTKMTILANGNVGIGNNGPTSLFSVGTTEQFKVSNTGAVTAVGLTSSAALSVTSGGASISGGLNNNSGNITNTGSITGVGANITGSGALTLASGASADLTLDSASNKLIIAATDTTLQRVATGSYTIDLSDGGATTLVLNNSGAGAASLDLNDGSLKIAGTTVLTNAGVLQNVTGDAAIITSGTFAVNRGGTGAATFTTNGVLFGNGTSAIGATSAGTGGQLLIANGSGVPTFVSLGTDATLSSTGALTIAADAVALGADTTGNYIASLGTVTGLTVGGTSGEGAIPTLSVNYGSSSTSAVRGDTTLVCPSASGNLSGGGNTITLGSGGTCSAISITNTPAFTSVTADTFTATGALAISSGGSGDITIDSASNKLIIAATDTTLQRNASGAYTIDLSNAAATSLKLDNSGAGAASLNLNDGDLQMAGTVVLTNARALQNLTGLTVSSGGASISGGLNNNSGGITNAGSITGVGTNITASAGLTIASGGSGALTLDSASNTLAIAASDTTLQRTASGTFTIDLNDASNTTLALSNSGTGVLNLNLSDGDLLTGGTSRLTNGGALQNITGYSQSSGNFAISGSGTFDTGTGAISLNGAVTAGSTVTVTGLTTLNGGLTMAAGDTFTFNGEGFTDLTGSGLIDTSGALTINLQTGSGLTVSASGLTNRRDCANNQILKWANGGGGSWGCANDGVSDARLKMNIEDTSSDMLDRIKDVRVVSFDYDCSQEAFQYMHCDTDHQTGVIAQELMQIFPELVSEVNGYYKVNYQGLSAYNLKAVSELANIINFNGDAKLNTVATGGELRLSNDGVLQNINGLNVVSGGASLHGGLNNNGGGITNAGPINGVTFLSGNAIELNSNGTDNLLTLKKDGNGVFTIFNDGAVEVKLDSANAFAVKSNSGLTHFNIDTNGNFVSIGSPDGDDHAILFTLDNKNTAGDPAGVNGSQYYNGFLKKFRCYENDQWKDCISSTVATQKADQTVSSTTLTDATDLSLAVAANESDTFEAAINLDIAGSAPSVSYTFTAPLGAFVSITTTMPTGATTNSTCNITSAGQVCTVNFPSAYRGTLIVKGQIMNGSTAGRLRFQFAQDNPAGTTVITLKKGSSLSYIRTDQ